MARVMNGLQPGKALSVDGIAEAAEVPVRKTRILLTLLKREGAVGEYRGGGWERLVDDVARTDLEANLVDYEARGEADREKLHAMVAYCRNARCRTRFIREYFGEEAASDEACGHCDNDPEP